MQTYIFKKVL